MLAPCVCVTVYGPTLALAAAEAASGLIYIRAKPSQMEQRFGSCPFQFLCSQAAATTTSPRDEAARSAIVARFCAHLFHIYSVSFLVKSEIKAKQQRWQHLFLAAINAEFNCYAFYAIFFLTHNVARQFCAPLNHWRNIEHFEVLAVVAVHSPRTVYLMCPSASSSSSCRP